MHPFCLFFHYVPLFDSDIEIRKALIFNFDIFVFFDPFSASDVVMMLLCPNK
jgi:hypothetical protein